MKIRECKYIDTILILPLKNPLPISESKERYIMGVSDRFKSLSGRDNKKFIPQKRNGLEKNNRKAETGKSMIKRYFSAAILIQSILE